MTFSMEYFALVALTAFVAGFFWTFGAYLCAKIFK